MPERKEGEREGGRSFQKDTGTNMKEVITISKNGETVRVKTLKRHND